jgi:hypothetical protein
VRSYPAILLLTLCLSSNGCTFRTVETTEIGTSYYTRRVLLATQYSEFKEAVVTRLLESFKDDPVYFKVIDVRDLKQESTEPYQAVFIANTCIAWRLNSHVVDFLEKTREKEKVILLTTVGGKNWQPEVAGVDAITSASNRVKVEEVAEVIIDRIGFVLESQP